MRKKLTFRIVGVIAVGFALPSWVSAECFNAENAPVVQVDSGQGNYDCSVLSDSGGVPLINLRDRDEDGVFEDEYVHLKFDESVNGTIEWNLIGVDKGIDEFGRPLWDVSFVSTNNKGQGKRCNYISPDVIPGDSGLGAKDSGDVILEDVSVCASVTPLTYDAPPAENFITDIDNACLALIDAAGLGEEPIETDVTIGFTVGKVDAEGNPTPATIAFCTSQPNGFTQLECAPNEGAPPREVMPYCSFASTYEDGSYSVADCAPIELTRASDGLKYCFYYENKVCEPTAPVRDHCDDRVEAGVVASFLPRPVIDTFDVNVEVRQGSYGYISCGRARCTSQ